MFKTYKNKQGYWVEENTNGWWVEYRQNEVRAYDDDGNLVDVFRGDFREEDALEFLMEAYGVEC